jgi:hypothetical protein
MCRYGAGAVVFAARPEVAYEAVSGGYAEVVEPDPAPVPAVEESVVDNNDGEDDGA